MARYILRQSELERSLSPQERYRRIGFWIILLIVFLALLMYLFYGDDVPEAYSLHMISQEDRMDRIHYFVDDSEQAETLWERIDLMRRGMFEEGLDHDLEVYFELYFSRGDALMDPGGRVQIWPERIQLNGEAHTGDFSGLFQLLWEEMASPQALSSLILDMDPLYLKDERGEHPIEDGVEELAQITLDLHLESVEEKGSVQEDGRWLGLILEPGILWVDDDGRAFMDFWGGFWLYSGGETLYFKIQQYIE